MPLPASIFPVSHEISASVFLMSRRVVSFDIAPASAAETPYATDDLEADGAKSPTDDYFAAPSPRRGMPRNRTRRRRLCRFIPIFVIFAIDTRCRIEVSGHIAVRRFCVCRRWRFRAAANRCHELVLLPLRQAAQSARSISYFRHESSLRCFIH